MDLSTVNGLLRRDRRPDCRSVLVAWCLQHQAHQHRCHRLDRLRQQHGHLQLRERGQRRPWLVQREGGSASRREGLVQRPSLGLQDADSFRCGKRHPGLPQLQERLSSTEPAKVVTAFTNAAGFAAMDPALALTVARTMPSSFCRSPLHLLCRARGGARHHNDYASILSAAAALGDSFDVLLSATRQEAVDFAQYAYSRRRTCARL